jgi:prepilin-type N-terminal cleavage/methylation domain-containing protein
MSRRPSRGFTLLEVLLALSIVGAVLALAFGGLRIGLAAWRQGEDRAERFEHARNLQLVLAKALAGTHPYRGQMQAVEQPLVLFRGIPVVYTAVTLAHQDAAPPGLIIRQKVLPNYNPFEAVKPSLTDTGIAAVSFRYLREQDGAWVETWDPGPEGTMPRAIEVTLTANVGGRAVPQPPFTVSIRATTAP